MVLSWFIDSDGSSPGKAQEHCSYGCWSWANLIDNLIQTLRIILIYSVDIPFYLLFLHVHSRLLWLSIIYDWNSKLFAFFFHFTYWLHKPSTLSFHVGNIDKIELVGLWPMVGVRPYLISQYWQNHDSLSVLIDYYFICDITNQW